MKVCFVALLAAFAASQPASDKVIALPGYKGTLPTMYSGYLNVNQSAGQNLHYVFVQSESSTWQTDPVVLWLNGGPGCSSLDGFFYEQGPLHFTGPENDLTLVLNPYRWNLVANMIFLEAPAGVGFSYAVDPVVYNTNDNMTADANHIAVQQWLQAFPMFAKNDFYVSGESYAGIYVPTLSYRLAQDPTINFKGMLVGNGVTSWEYMSGALSEWPFLNGHGIIPTSVYEDLTTYCGGGANPNHNAQCKAAQQVAADNMKNIDVYDVYSQCFHQRPNLAQLLPHRFKDSLTQFGNSGISPPCVDSSKASKYLNQLQVQMALHVVTNITWYICSTSPLHYTDNTPSVIPIYWDLMENGFKVLVYSGDIDASVPFTGTQGWIDSLGLPASVLWNEWSYPTDSYLKHQVGGFVSHYEYGKFGLEFVTVRGAGHMVPQFQPQAALVMFKRFLETGSVLP